MTTLDTVWLAAHPLSRPGGETDKNARGRVLVAGGSALVPGALRLTGEAAFRAGAGKVQLATVETAALLLGVHMPEAAVIGLPANARGELAGTAGTALASSISLCDALVLGPGMGREAEPEPILRTLLDSTEGHWALVLDAAALAAASGFAASIRARNGGVVLTPHPGEMAALMNCDERRVREAPEMLVEEAAARFGATVVLKGAESWIATPGRPTLRYPGGGPGLATGGSGDVLAGVIGGLLARGTAPHVATAWAVWSHGEAGRGLARKLGELGFLARELLAELPGLLYAAR